MPIKNAAAPLRRRRRTRGRLGRGLGGLDLGPGLREFWSLGASCCFLQGGGEVYDLGFKGLESLPPRVYGFSGYWTLGGLKFRVFGVRAVGVDLGFEALRFRIQVMRLRSGDTIILQNPCSSVK